MNIENREYYKCQSDTCEDNGGTCTILLPKGYEPPCDCVNVASFKDNGDEPDCKWIKCSSPYVDVLNELENELKEMGCCGDVCCLEYLKTEVLPRLRKAGEQE